jgi:hypothetical protein
MATLLFTFLFGEVYLLPFFILREASFFQTFTVPHQAVVVSRCFLFVCLLFQCHCFIPPLEVIMSTH